MCSHQIEGIAVVITKGTIAEVQAYETIGSLPLCDVTTREANGLDTLTPEWQSHPMVSGVNEGRFTRLIEMPKLLSS
jgi:hypothetical protein